MIDGRYVIGDVLGVGGMGVVYSARQLSLARHVAVKLPRTDITQDDVVRRRFDTEILVAGRVSHRNVVAIMDAGEFRGTPYLIMEQARGQLLSRVLRERGKLDATLAIDVVAPLLDALAASHAAGIVHCDVKPENLYIEPSGASVFTRLFDFGVAHLVERATIEEPGMLYGTPEYIAPELIRGETPAASSDIYAAGIVLYELLTGVTPFAGGESHEVLARHLQMEITPPSRVCPLEHGELLDAVTLRALDKRPAHRYPDARSFADELRSVRRRIDEPQPSRLEIERLRANAARRSDDTINAYLALARSLVDDDQHLRAATELEQAVGLLCVWTDAGHAPRGLWRVYVTLAALYAHLGDLGRARRLATIGHHQAVIGRSTAGQHRAKALLARIGAPTAASDDRAIT